MAKWIFVMLPSAGAAKTPLTQRMSRSLNVRIAVMRVQNAVRVCAAMRTDVMSYQALNLANQIRLLGDAPNTP